MIVLHRLRTRCIVTAVVRWKYLRTRAHDVAKIPALCYKRLRTISMPDKIALVTGCSSGIGLLTSIELAKNGFRVVATMRDLSRRGRLDTAAAAAGVTAKLEIGAL